MSLFSAGADPAEHAAYQDHYLVMHSGYKAHAEDGSVFEPLICQPTPEGLKILVEKFRSDTGHDLRVVDQREACAQGDNFLTRFAHLKKSFDFASVTESHPIGLILSHGQQHAIPVLLMEDKGKKYMFIFDSTSGPTMKAYAKVANLFPDHHVMLNNGSRQTDSQSCITDSYELLTHAFRIKRLPELIRNRIAPDAEVFPKRRTHSVLNLPQIKARHDNFNIFYMPEELCFTAQKTDFIVKSAKADLQKKIIGPHGYPTTLEVLLLHNKAVAQFPGEDKNLYKGINPYLHQASWRHAEAIRMALSPASAGTGSDGES